MTDATTDLADAATRDAPAAASGAGARARAAEPPPPLDAVETRIEGPLGPMALYEAGEGPPLLLLHSLNAAASAFEVRPIFDAMKTTRRVFAVDLPGFGRSARPEGPYVIGTYVGAIAAVVDEIARRTGVRAVPIVALSLTCEFAARLAVARPTDVSALVMVTPTGFDARAGDLRGPEGSSRGGEKLERALDGPWGRPLHALLTSRPSIAFFLQTTFGPHPVPREMLDYCLKTAHAPGARHAVWAFASAKLFGADVRALYERIDRPVWLAHATKGAFKDFSKAGWIEDRPNWSRTAFPTGAFPHWETPDAFMHGLRGFLAAVEG